MDSRPVESPKHPLLQAAYRGNLKLLKELGQELDSGEGLAKSFVEVKDTGGRMALHFASAAGHSHICKYLVQDLGLDVNLKDGKGETPLIHATLGQQNQTVAWLTANGGNPNLGNDKGFRPLHYAALKGLKDLMGLLISKGAEIESESDCGTPLHCAAALGREEAVKMLLDRKANPNTICRIFTPLMNSVIAGSYECVGLLLKAGADPNLGLNGQTPLEIAAAAQGKTDILKCLLKAGANPNITDIHGLTPLEMAALHRLDEGAMVLFPATSRIPAIPNWSLACILKHVDSHEVRRQSALKRMETFELSMSRGREAFKRKDYLEAIYSFSRALSAWPLDPTVLSNRSLCWALLNDGRRALADAEVCVTMRPDWGKAHYREGVAWKLLGNLSMSSEAFSKGLKVDPENEELKVAFRQAVEAEFGIPVSDGIRIIRMEL